MTVIKAIQSDKYRAEVQAIRAEADTVAKRELKTKLPAVTFGGNFTKRRNMDNCLSATGFLTIDIDHVQNLDSIFKSLSQDEHIWFIFRSPSAMAARSAALSSSSVSRTVMR
jgi:hypothetical protein